MKDNNHRKADEALKKNEALYRAIGESIDYGVWVCAPDGRNTYASESFLRMAGITQEQCSNFGWGDVLHPDDAERTIAKWKECVRTGETWDIEHRFRGVDGQWHHVLARGVPVKDDQGTVTCWAGINLDITALKHAEQELKKAHDELEQRVSERTEQLASAVGILQMEIEVRKKAEAELEKSAREIEDLYNLAPCGYHSLDRDGTFVRINDTGLQWLGYQREEVVGRLKAADLMTPESRTVFEQFFPGFIEGNSISDLRLSFVRKDGSYLPVLLNATPIMDGDGDYLMSRSTIYDITELVRVEDSVQKLNRLYLTLSETGKAIAHLSDRDELFQEICRIVVVHGGFRMAWIGLVDAESDLIRPAASFGSGTDYLDVISISIRPEAEVPGPTATAIRSGNLYICNNFMTDPGTVPWRKEAEKRGFRASASVCIKQNDAPIGVLAIYAGEEEYFDQQMVDLLMRMQDDISFALDNLERASQQRAMQNALQTEMHERLQAVETLREREQMLIQQSRNAAMGEMIGNIAHQWRQPLNTLGLFTQRLGYFYGTPSFNKEFLDDSVEKTMEIIQFMSRTIDDFRNFFSTEREKVRFRVDEALHKALSLVEASFKDCRINLEKEVRDDAVAFGFPNEYAQVLLNIFINAKDALTERNIRLPRIKITVGTENGISVVTIADNAGGIPEEIAGKIFDPYFTTKGPQQGTGVGLFMSKTIIENNMGGRLSARNTDEGAEFRIEV
jgi:PAS domain S-box-containing protein